MIRDVIKDSPGERVFLLGNEAIARGAIEAGIDVYAAYPGTPSSEIADTLNEACRLLKGKMEFYMEYSVNEKVAFEVAVGASLAGKRGMCGMKHVGLNVAADALFSFAYIGARGGFVCVTADDPSMHSSQNEQDNRWFGKAAKVPVIEPSSIQEAKDFTKLSFELSEKFNLPFLLRTVTRLNHASGIVELGRIPEKKIEKVDWQRNPRTDVILPAHARQLKPLLFKKLEKLQNYFSKSTINWVEHGNGDKENKGIIASGLSYVYVKEALKRLNAGLPVLKISSMYPIPEKLIADFISELDSVAVVEEVDPFLETHVRVIAAEYGVEVTGKMNGVFPLHYENNVSRVEEGVARFLGIKSSVNCSEALQKATEIAKLAPPRPPVLCPGCPHTASFYAIRKVVNEIGDASMPSDIGCYTLGINTPLEAVDITICMGASVGVSNGLSYFLNQPIIATIGDSTFFHAGIPPLINAVYNGNRFVLVILDNLTTGMTGHQPHPGMGAKGCGEEAKTVRIEDVVKGIGVDFVEVVNPYNISKIEDALHRALNHDGVAVIIARQKCAILWTRERKRKGIRITPFYVTDKCNGCMKCVAEFTCPAIYVGDRMEGGLKTQIDEVLCAGCGVCATVCPERAIKATKAR
jgi:indolepyruvate ferredoxin oxidoreductase alpha subunit